MGSNRGLKRPIRIRVLDATESEANRTAAVCGKLPMACATPTIFTDTQKCLDALTEFAADILILDLETLGGEEEISRFAVRSPSAIILAVSARGSVSRAVEAMRAGAHDFLTKPFSLDMLASKISSQIEMHHLPVLEEAEASEVMDALESPMPTSNGFGAFVGMSRPMQDIYEKIERMAPSSAPVFITGESGTGKELCAQAIHAASSRSKAKFVTINCAAIPHNLMESEIFGHARGAFTGADETRLGAAELANGGTLFLDEIGEMDTSLQSKLLRFLQTGTIQRLGDPQSRQIDVRIICATNRDPAREIEAGRFREDLFYRLHVLPIRLPALKDRHDDILPLAASFLERFSAEEHRQFQTFDADVQTRLITYTWPGNVRQLENTIRQIVVMNDSPAVTMDMLPLVIREGRHAGRSPAEDVRDRALRSTQQVSRQRPFASIEPLWAQERRIIEDTLDAFGGNIAMAAAALEISPSTIYRKRQSWSEKAA